MKNFLTVILIVLGLFNFLFFILFFDLNTDIIKLLLSEISIIIVGIVVILINNSNLHEGFKIASGLVSAMLAAPQLIISYFVSGDLKFNFIFFSWALILFIQAIILASSFLIKPRP
jgi:hypothetical protein